MPSQTAQIPFRTGIRRAPHLKLVYHINESRGVGNNIFYAIFYAAFFDRPISRCPNPFAAGCRAVARV